MSIIYFELFHLLCQRRDEQDIVLGLKEFKTERSVKMYINNNFVISRGDLCYYREEAKFCGAQRRNCEELVFDVGLGECVRF